MKHKLPKIEIRQIYTDVKEFHDMTLDETVEYIKSLKKEINNTWGPIQGQAKFYYDFYGHNGEYDVQIIYNRLETESEYQKRCEEIEKQDEIDRIKAEKQKTRELAELKRLKEKYESMDIRS